MKITCIVCGKQGEKPPFENNLVSHGICSLFCERVYSDWLALDKSKPSLVQYYRNRLLAKGGKVA